MPEEAVKENVEYPCRGHQNGQRIRVEFQAEAVQKQQAQNLWYERGSNDIGRKANTTRNLGRGLHQHRLP
tara:strand:- start:1863 stop:2072 length:210 start_codon:yes stop_codon:yes gene_type:complete